MLRFRRYRVFVFVAVVFTLLVVQLKHFGEWSPYSQSPNLTSPQSPKDGDLSQAKSDTPPVVKVPAKDVPHTSIAPIPKTTTTTTKVKATSTKSPSAETPSKVVLPDRKPVPPTKVHDLDKEEDGIHPIPPPGRQELPTFPSVPKVIHWEKQVEHFPVPKESIITLPTGSPKAIPKIQYKFDDETPDAKHDREKRQNMVKAEFKKAWTGYKTKAWLHDELSPVSGKFRDPFCGWAATLVDTLDTLWIMGLQEEFEEAAKAVDQIDFTTSPRADIPVFETTIRYLGGLLAAYDVSGAAYKNLLDKAVELAEILMGIFDTPNRMPDLYYRWKPTFASQAHRAGVRSNLAELGSLSMEFTRLAQITRDPRYYDAVARITLALSEWQDRGTMLDGVFPDNVDASGCNRTEVAKQAPYSNEKDPVLVPAQVNEEPIGFQPTTKSNKPSPATDKTIRKSTSESGQVESKVASGDSGKIGTSKKLAKRLSEGMPPVNQTLSKSTQPTVDPITGLPLDIPAAKAKIGSTVGNWDCVPQGLEPASPYGMNKFSMGGGQDSTYEYFPKQFLLLGGLEDIYRKMYMKTIAAIREHMLYRPMTKDGRDILFSGSITTYGRPGAIPKLSADVEHLTCFVGGMVGMSAKIFGLDQDIEIAKKLADGCVWAYESFPSGIMAEGATVMPCENSEVCPWNETAYWEYLDPVAPGVREKQIIDYEIQKALRAQEEAATAARVLAEKQAAAEAAALATELPSSSESGSGSKIGTHTGGSQGVIEPSKDSSSPEKGKSTALDKREGDGAAKAGPQVLKRAPVEPSTVSLSAEEKSYAQKARDTDAELHALASTTGHQAEKPLKPPPVEPLVKDPFKPLSHKEFVERKIREQSLPPGFVSIKSRKYILRPEAIESVWYMYRITGDKTWQDKGWKMFTSIINATSTEHGHSAIVDVTSENPYQVDEMESFWLAETLKYFYLLYSSPDTISLDEWVLNTEAHPFKRPI